MPPPDRIVLLVTSPRLPAGLLTAEAWDLVRTHGLWAAAESGQTAALRASGVSVTLLEPSAEALLAVDGTVVWLAGPAGDPALARDVGMRLVREPGRAELELMYGSWDPPGARLLDAVAVIDRLASPGGDPWLGEHAAPLRTIAQTHRSLARFLLEEVYEAYDAIEAGDLTALREELGDLLLQVVLHARLAAEWTVDDVAGDLVDKMIRRNPHVFGDESTEDVEEITENWERIKRAEKARSSELDGIALAQPALALATKILSRVERAGLSVPLPPSGDLGASLLRVVADAQTQGLDAEGELRQAALAYAAAARAAEAR